MRVRRLLLVAVTVGAVSGPLAVLGATAPTAGGSGTSGTVDTVLPAAAVPPPAVEVQPEPSPVVEVLVEQPVVPEGDGVPVRVPGTGRPAGSGPLVRYSVAVEGGLGIDPVAFAAEVEAVLSDPRSWGAGGRGTFQRVDSDPVDVKVVLASPATTDRLCAPLTTGGTLSCGVGEVAVLNALRWLRGADAYEGELGRYRQYLVNHEVGHTLGHGHERCPGPGRPAPVMVQQTLGVGECVAQPWPYPSP